jgi:ribosomal protein S18 acetylase RimI-like enzyme
VKRKRRSSSPPKLRRGRVGDIDALLFIERAVFTTDILSRRSFRHFLTSRTATLVVAVIGGMIAGYALVLYPPRSTLARLYSLAVAPHRARRGIGKVLLAAVEKAAKQQGALAMRLEVNVRNNPAIALYQTSGYCVFGRRPRYYGGRDDALRFEKPLTRRGTSPRSRRQP